MTSRMDQRPLRGAVSAATAVRRVEMLGNRVKKSFARWHRHFERQNVGAFRICDPLSFSTRGGPSGSFDVQRDRPWLLGRVLELAPDGGRVHFSTNHQRFIPRLGSLPVSSCEELTHRTVPADFRNRTAHPCVASGGLSTP